jgi:hypothetical protein
MLAVARTKVGVVTKVNRANPVVPAVAVVLPIAIANSKQESDRLFEEMKPG